MNHNLWWGYVMMWWHHLNVEYHESLVELDSNDNVTGLYCTTCRKTFYIPRLNLKDQS